MATPAKIGIEEVDKLVLKALDQGLQFPPTTPRWRFLAWAAEELELQRQLPTDFARGGFRRIWEEYFGPQARPR